MEQMLATPADAEIILKLYELRTEAVMRQARAWVGAEFWPQTAEEFFVVFDNPADPHNAFLRQVVGYWEMAAAMVLHGAVSADLFVDCNSEGFFLLANQLASRFTTAAQRYEVVLKRVEARRNRMNGQPAGEKYFYPPKEGRA
jgi:hypothetical protein